MSPKDKAEQLIKRYFNEVVQSKTFHTFKTVRECDYFDECKRMAMIAVHEIIEALETTTGHCTLRKLDYQEVKHDFEYWDKVKVAIKEF